jgi:hypothetical protein
MVTVLGERPFQPSSGRSAEIGFSSDSVGIAPGILRAAKNVDTERRRSLAKNASYRFPSRWERRTGRFLFLDFHHLLFTR